MEIKKVKSGDDIRKVLSAANLNAIIDAANKVNSPNFGVGKPKSIDRAAKVLRCYRASGTNPVIAGQFVELQRAGVIDDARNYWVRCKIAGGKPSSGTPLLGVATTNEGEIGAPFNVALEGAVMAYCRVSDTSHPYITWPETFSGSDAVESTDSETDAVGYLLYATGTGANVPCIVMLSKGIASGGGETILQPEIGPWSFSLNAQGGLVLSGGFYSINGRLQYYGNNTTFTTWKPSSAEYYIVMSLTVLYDNDAYSYSVAISRVSFSELSQLASSDNASVAILAVIPQNTDNITYSAEEALPLIRHAPFTFPTFVYTMPYIEE